MAKLYYQGHGSFRLTTESGKVIYIDPFAGDGYDKPADLILVTHQHPDHNQISLPPHAEGCVVYQNSDALKDGVYQTAEFTGVTIEAVEAYNDKHDRASCVGYLLSVDGLLLYFAGDTAMTEQMKTLSQREIDYAFLPTDGIFTMDIPAAIRCAEAIGAKHTIPMHMSPGSLYDEEKAKGFVTPSAMLIKPGEEIDL